MLCYAEVVFRCREFAGSFISVRAQALLLINITRCSGLQSKRTLQNMSDCAVEEKRVFT